MEQEKTHMTRWKIIAVNGTIKKLMEEQVDGSAKSSEVKRSVLRRGILGVE